MSLLRGVDCIKWKRVQEEEALIVKEGARLIALMEFEARNDREKLKKWVRTERDEIAQRRCRLCN